MSTVAAISGPGRPSSSALALLLVLALAPAMALAQDAELLRRLGDGGGLSAPGRGASAASALGGGGYDGSGATAFDGGEAGEFFGVGPETDPQGRGRWAYPRGSADSGLFRNPPLPRLPQDYPGGGYLRSYPLTPLSTVPAESLFPRQYRRVQERQAEQRARAASSLLREWRRDGALPPDGETMSGASVGSDRDDRGAASGVAGRGDPSGGDGRRSARELLRDPRLPDRSGSSGLGRRPKAGKGVDGDPEGRDPRTPSTGRRSALSDEDFGDALRFDRVEAPVPMTLEELEPFGYAFFEGAARRNVVPPSAAVPTHYALGPEDGFMVHAWNDMQDLTLPLQVDRRGMIHLPNVGEFFVWGLTVDQVEKLLRKELSRQFADLKLTLSMVTLRKLSVYVVGEVRRPGLHLLDGLSTVINALVAAGGPSERGTLRAVQVRRGKKETSRLDLYDFFLRGERADDLKLADGDVVVVGLRGATAAVAGHVRRPAIYELLGETTVGSLVELAGGIRPDGYAHLVHLERTVSGRRREARDLELPAERDEKIRDGDLLRIDPVYEVVENVVVLEGNVERPGAYQWSDGMRVSDLLRLGRRLLAKTHMGRADLVRYLGEAHRYPGPAGTPKRTLDTEVVAIDLEALQRGDESWDWPLRPLDRLVVHHRDQILPPLSVEISGEVEHEGLFPLTAGMRLSDLVALAGGLRRSAFALHVELGRVRSTSPFRTDVIRVDLGRALAGEAEHDLLLQPDDRVFVKRVPEFDLERYVVLEGELRFPGRYLFNPGDRLVDVVRRAGGYTDRAFLPGAFFTREAVREVQGQKLEEFRREQRMRLTQLQQDLSTSVGYVDPREKEIQMASIRSRETMLQAVEGIEANGRIVMHLDSDLDVLAKSRFNVELQAGDTLAVPPVPAEITVIGEVLQPGSILFEPGHTMAWYLEKVGGLTRRADRSLLSILRADGTTVSRAGHRHARSYWSYDARRKSWTRVSGRFDRIRVERGDVLLVPARIALRRNRSREVIDAVYKSAVSIGALAGLFK